MDASAAFAHCESAIVVHCISVDAVDDSCSIFSIYIAETLLSNIASAILIATCARRNLESPDSPRHIDAFRIRHLVTDAIQGLFQLHV